MNRRSLLLGGLVAGAAGIMGVKAATKVEPEHYGWDDDEAIDTSPSGYVTPEDTGLSALIPAIWSQEAISTRTSGYAINQLLRNKTFTFPTDQMITVKYPVRYFSTSENVDYIFRETDPNA